MRYFGASLVPVWTFPLALVRLTYVMCQAIDHMCSHIAVVFTYHQGTAWPQIWMLRPLDFTIRDFIYLYGEDKQTFRKGLMRHANEWKKYDVVDGCVHF